MSAIVEVKDVSKAYNLYANPREIVKEAIFGGVRHDVFWALRDVSFAVAEGQRLGIIGPNGAGKSTLLKTITGNLQPTNGSVHVDGTVSAMLSLTSFLNQDETGLENIRFNLIVNGVRKRDIPRLTEEIVDFTELGAFIRAPVRTYSSGMQARLSFAITTSLTPDILVVDEVLGAGDAYFVGKATQRMIELCDQGRALLFVSHSMAAVQLLCDTVVWLQEGAVREIGPVEEVTRHYEEDFRRQEDAQTRAGNRERRARLASTVTPEEFGRPDVLRFRLIGDDGLSAQHYVRSVSVALGEERFDVPLELADIDEPGVTACLDVLHSEWGRQHTRRGVESRALATSSRKLRGGHILVRALAAPAEVDAEITFESVGDAGATEHLIVQYVDPRSGEWVDLDELERADLGDGWQRVRARRRVATVAGISHAEILQRIIENNRPDVEIVGIAILADGRRRSTVREREPFEIAIGLNAWRRIPVADVGVRLIRADGVYAFWQSSGDETSNLTDLEGPRTVVFSFDPNLFGGGEYDVSAYVANGFDPETNYPYHEVYDRRVSDVRLTVVRGHRIIDYGVVNHRFSVRVSEGVELFGDEPSQQQAAEPRIVAT